MIFTAAIKRICSICFYMTFASFFCVLFGGTNLFVTLPVFMLVAFSSAWMAELGKIRYISLAFFLAVIFIMPLNPANIITIVPACGYMILTMPKPQKSPKMYEGIDYVEYADVFKKFLSVFAVALPIALISRNFEALENGPISFAVSYMLLSVILLRTLRHDVSVINERRFKLFNIAYVAAVAVIGFLLSLDIVLRGFRAVINFIANNIVHPVLMFLTFIIYFVLGLIFNIEEVVEEIDEDPEIVEIGDMLPGFQEGEEPGIVATIIMYILVAALILLALYLLVKLTRYLIKKLRDRKRPSTRMDSGGIRTPLSFERIEVPNQQKSRRAKQNQIREIYRKFLALCREREIDIKQFMTSQDVENAAAEHFNKPQSQELREMYIKVRYADADFSKEDVKKAKGLYNEISSTKQD